VFGCGPGGDDALFTRSSGLTIDHIRAVDVLLADGTRVRADHTEEPDLYWAMRGAGDSVGIALGFEIDATATQNRAALAASTHSQDSLLDPRRVRPDCVRYARRRRIYRNTF
jgi:FAD/FMN-containing dehydrogenase